MENETEVMSNHTSAETDPSYLDWIAETEVGYKKLSKAFENLDEETKAWLAERKEAAKHIDPEAAEVTWCYATLDDPYGVIADFPEEIADYGRAYFARQPGSEIWVEFGDLSDDVRQKIRAKQRGEIEFPAGLYDLFKEAYETVKAESTDTDEGEFERIEKMLGLK